MNFLDNNTVQFPITAGLDDNHDYTDNLTVELCVKMNNLELLSLIMTHFSSGGRTFNANVTLDFELNTYYNISYYVVSSDLSLNNITPKTYWFILIVPSTTTPVPLIKAFGIFIILSVISITSYLTKKLR